MASPRRFPQPTVATAGPFVGVRDAYPPASARPDKLAGGVNVYAPPGADGELRNRPGFIRVAASIGSGAPQCVLQHELDGDEHTLVVVGGQVYASVLGSAFSDFTPGVGTGVSIAATGFVYGLTFGTEVVFSDGVNRPWKAPADVIATDAAYLTDVTGAWRGAPTVYYGKLFGIKADGLTLEWSEEADANTGYSHADYDNTWVLAQTDQSPLTAILGTNEALYYWRQASMGAIRGQVTANFRNDGTHDGLSTTIGTLSPAAIVTVGTRVWFLDQLGRPHAIENGQVVPLWDDCAETVRQQDVTYIANAWAIYAPEQDVVLFGIPNGANVVTQLLAFRGSTGQYQGTWTSTVVDGFRRGGVYMRYDAGNRPTVGVFSGTSTAFFRLASEYDETQDKTADYTTTTIKIPVTCTLPPLGYEAEAEHVTDEVTVTSRRSAGGEIPVLSLRYRTPRGDYGSWLTTGTDTVAALAETDIRRRFGTNARGRWVQHQVSNQAELNAVRFVLQTVTQRGRAVGVNEGGA